MNNDPTPSSAAGQPSSHHEHRDTSHNRDANISLGHNGDAHSSSSSEVSRMRKAGLSKKLQFMTHLMKSLDMLVFVEICTLYYMECSFPRLLLRVIPHYFFLTPKSDDFVLLLPAHRPHVFSIFIPNVLCMLLHLIFSPSYAGEATRGYLHGGVIIDFIGQKAPTSRISLLLLDVMILAIQCLMLAVHQDRERLRKMVHPVRQTDTGTSTNTAGATSSTPAITTRDHDAAERGAFHQGPSSSLPSAGDEADGIELRPLPPSDTRETEDDPEATGLLDGSSLSTAPAADLISVLRSGNAILADFHVIHTVRTVGNDYQSAAAYSLQTIGYTTTLAALAAERRARLEAQRRQQ